MLSEAKLCPKGRCLLTCSVISTQYQALNLQRRDHDEHGVQGTVVRFPFCEWRYQRGDRLPICLGIAGKWLGFGVRLGCGSADRWSYFGLFLSAPSSAFMQKLLI